MEFLNPTALWAVLPLTVLVLILEYWLYRPNGRVVRLAAEVIAIALLVACAANPVLQDNQPAEPAGSIDLPALLDGMNRPVYLPRNRP